MFFAVSFVIAATTLIDVAQCNAIPDVDRIELTQAEYVKQVLAEQEILEKAAGGEAVQLPHLQLLVDSTMEASNTDATDQDDEGGYVQFADEYNREDDQKTMPPMKFETIAACRRACLMEYLIDSQDSLGGCEPHSNCLMCWDYCAFLHGQKRNKLKAICNDPTCVSI